MENYEDFVQHMHKIADINCAAAVLHWDKEVNMPPRGNRFRARQLATLSGLGHTHFVDDAFGKLLKSLSDNTSLDEKQSANVSRTLEDYEKATSLDEEFVVKRSRAISECHEAWLNSRRENDCAQFLDQLKPLIDIKREEAERFGYDDHPYDALLDQYEPGLTAARCVEIFEEIKQQLLPFIEKMRQHMPDERPVWLDREVDQSLQLQYGKIMCERLGYDFDRGRKDLSEHPFTTSFSADDVRITTRVDSFDFSNMLWSTIHEVGHALYEQGLPVDDYGLPSGQAASLAMHESQARLWENQIGRSKWFWKEYFPEFKRFFSPVFDDIDFGQFMRGINHISPGLIRTESDELHYHLHILIRFEIEKSLMEQKIEVGDLPEMWRKKYNEYLDVEVPDDKQGILQDIHWAHGSIGYFPTYSLGSLYAAQLFETACSRQEINHKLERADTDPLLQWLRTNLHVLGRTSYPEELCKEITGNTLDLDPFLDYAENKYHGIFS